MIIIENYRTLVLIILFILLSGCGSLKTSKDHYLELDQKVDFFDFRGAANLLESAKNDNYGEKDRVLACLDLGMLYHYAGDYEKSNELFQLLTNWKTSYLIPEKLNVGKKKQPNNKQ